MTDLRELSRSLVVRAGAVILAVEIAVLTGVGYLYISRFNAEINDRLRSRISIPGELMQNGTLSMAAVGDDEVMREIIGGELLDAFVIDPTHTVVYSLNDAFYREDASSIPNIDVAWLTPRPSPPFHLTPGALIHVSPVFTTDESSPAFYVLLRMSTAQAQRDEFRVVTLVVLGSLAAIVLTSLAILIVFRRMIFDRLSALAETVREVGQGDLAARTSEAAANDELGRLQSGIDAMTEDLQKRETDRRVAEKELAAHRDHLEVLVSERTEELALAQKEILKHERLATLGRLIATVSHELRNPLGTMVSSLSVMRTAASEDNQTLNTGMDRISRNIDRCVSVIDQLLDSTRPQPAKLHPVELSGWLASVLSDQEKPSDLEVTTSLGNSATVFIDDGRLRRAVVNVFANAVQAVEAVETVGPPSQGRVRIEIVEDDGRIGIGVQDNGVGIPTEMLEQVFEPLVTTRAFGVGLGLHIVRQIMDEHHGDVELTSKQGEGTTVTLWLPFDSRQGDGDGAVEKTPVGESPEPTT